MNRFVTLSFNSKNFIIIMKGQDIQANYEKYWIGWRESERKYYKLLIPTAEELLIKDIKSKLEKAQARVDILEQQLQIAKPMQQKKKLPSATSIFPWKLCTITLKWQKQSMPFHKANSRKSKNLKKASKHLKHRQLSTPASSTEVNSASKKHRTPCFLSKKQKASVNDYFSPLLYLLLSLL